MQPSLFIPRRETPLALDKRRLSLLFDVLLKVDFFMAGAGGGEEGAGRSIYFATFLQYQRTTNLHSKAERSVLALKMGPFR